MSKIDLYLEEKLQRQVTVQEKRVFIHFLEENTKTEYADNLDMYYTEERSIAFLDFSAFFQKHIDIYVLSEQIKITTYSIQEIIKYNPNFYIKIKNSVFIKKHHIENIIDTYADWYSLAKLSALLKKPIRDLKKIISVFDIKPVVDNVTARKYSKKELLHFLS